MTETVRYPYRSPFASQMHDVFELAKWSARRVVSMEQGKKYLPDLLKRRVIAWHARKYDLRTFVESGTYLGTTVSFMRRYCGRLYSIEFQPRLAKAAQERFAGDSSIRILEGNGAVLMPKILAELHEPALFWLDGHFAVGTTSDAEVACPTMEELSAVLADTRYPHVVLIDDAREFRGEAGYPTLESVQQFIRSARPDTTVRVQDDIVRVLPREAPFQGD